jgi:hypothetical protein
MSLQRAPPGARFVFAPAARRGNLWRFATITNSHGENGMTKVPHLTTALSGPLLELELTEAAPEPKTVAQPQLARI